MCCRERENSARDDFLAARDCRASSIEENDRVMTMLFSSAAGSRTVRSQLFSSSDSEEQVMPRVGTRYSLENKWAALTASEVWPEREMTTTWVFSVVRPARPGNSSGSEAGSARAAWPVSSVQVAAAASAR